MASQCTIPAREIGGDSPLSYESEIGSGALKGVVKENLSIAGMPDLAGLAEPLSSAPSDHNAVAVDRVLAGDCSIVGRAKMHELAFGLTGINPAQGTPINPLFPDRVPGGSSSGSAAAVAQGLADFALGTDTGGSVRVPATCCGVIGFKPTFGAISRAGVVPVSSTLDCVGIFSRDMNVLSEIARLCIENFGQADVSALPRIGVVDLAETHAIEGAITAAVQSSLDRADASISSAPLPGMIEADEAGKNLIAAEMWSEFGGQEALLARLSPAIRDRLMTGAQTGADELAEIERVRRVFAGAVDAALENLDMLALPTLPIIPPTLAEAESADFVPMRLTQLVRPFNLSGHPAISLPLLTEHGLPAGLQLVARRGEDATLCAVASKLLNSIEEKRGEAL